jgi:hypothetical protein
MRTRASVSGTRFTQTMLFTRISLRPRGRTRKPIPEAPKPGTIAPPHHLRQARRDRRFPLPASLSGERTAVRTAAAASRRRNVSPAAPGHRAQRSGIQARRVTSPAFARRKTLPRHRRRVDRHALSHHRHRIVGPRQPGRPDRQPAANGQPDPPQLSTRRATAGRAAPPASRAPPRWARPQRCRRSPPSRSRSQASRRETRWNPTPPRHCRAWRPCPRCP